MTTAAPPFSLDRQTLEGEDSLDESQLKQPNGQPWPFVARMNGLVIGAASPTGIVGTIVDGYDELPFDEAGNDEALGMRWEMATQLSIVRQGQLVAQAEIQGLFDPSVESEESLTALLGDRTEPIEGISHWDHPVLPLVLVVTDYAPWTGRIAPTGNIEWIDPHTDASLLRSLHSIGVLEYREYE